MVLLTIGWIIQVGFVVFPYSWFGCVWLFGCLYCIVQYFMWFIGKCCFYVWFWIRVRVGPSGFSCFLWFLTLISSLSQYVSSSGHLRWWCTFIIVHRVIKVVAFLVIISVLRWRVIFRKYFCFYFRSLEKNHIRFIWAFSILMYISYSHTCSLSILLSSLVTFCTQISLYW